MDVAEVLHLPVGRLLAVDERGVGMRATWHLEHGIVNLTLWRADRCVETFHLSIEDAGRLTGFLLAGFAQVTQSAVGPHVTTPRRRGIGDRARALVARLGRTLRRQDPAAQQSPTSVRPPDRIA